MCLCTALGESYPYNPDLGVLTNIKISTYSFFDNYDVSCSQQDVEGKCQTRIVSIEDSSVSIYNLNTIGATSMATVNGVDIASWADNRNNFVSTIAVLKT